MAAGSLGGVFVLISGCLLLLLLSRNAGATGDGLFDITSFGAVADGKTDAVAAVLAAWKKACAWEGSSSSATLLIPSGTFLVGPVTLQGPCKGPVVVQLQGTVIAPPDPEAFTDDHWVSFESIQGLTVTGGGVFDGQGALAWKRGHCDSCKKLPTNIRFNALNDATIEGISSINSKWFHIRAEDSDGITFRLITVSAPGDSPNTDGIHVSNSTGVSISDSIIGTGDDCVSVSAGTTRLSVSNITCGPGHGISIGSLGKIPNEKDVSDVLVLNCQMTNTKNGVRIKTWPSSYPMSASHMTFANIRVTNVSHPIVIDQEYCPHGSCDMKSPSKVQISDITFRNISGTSATEAAVQLICSKAFPCRNVSLIDIDLVSSDAGKAVNATCQNVQGSVRGQMIPPSCI